jgi:hypothetical protein
MRLPHEGLTKPWCEQVCGIGSELADALHFAHCRGVLHCDVKPANILLDVHNTPKLLDFNAALGRIESFDIGGTWAYMSPEQLDAFAVAHEWERKQKIAALDGRSDIYSLGVVMWELLTGTRPFQDTPNQGDWTGTLTAMARERKEWPVVRRAGELPPGVPPGLRQVLLRCLQPAPEARYADAGELAGELRLFAHPGLQDLLFPPENGLRSLILRWPLCTAIVLAVLCNVLLSLLNIVYNWEIVFHLPGFPTEKYFAVAVPSINIPGFAAGILTSLYLGWPVARWIHRLRSGVPGCPEQDVIARCILLGHGIAVVGSVIWSTASVAWGGWMWDKRPLIDVKLVHFAGSVLLSGFIAGALTFCVVSCVCVRCVLPRLVRESRSGLPHDLEPQIKLHLRLLLVSPFLAMLLAVYDFTNVAYLMIWLAALVAAGTYVGLPCVRQIRADLDLLSRLDASAQR